MNVDRVLTILRAQHQAIDLLLARVCMLDPNFRPSHSLHIWQAVVDGHKLIHDLEASRP